MKKVLLLLAGFMAVSTMVFAQEEEGENTDAQEQSEAQSESRFINEMTFSGEMRFSTQMNMDGTSYVHVDQSELNFNYKFTKYTGVNMQLQLGKFGGEWSGGFWNAEDPNLEDKVTSSNSHGYTDILGELGMDDHVGLKFTIGLITDNSNYLADKHALGFGFMSGDDIQTDVVKDKWNIRWDVPIYALSDTFPLKIWMIHDADFSRSNNDFSTILNIESEGMTLMDGALAIDWNIYYAYIGSAQWGIDGGRDTGNVDADGNPILEGGWLRDPDGNPEGWYGVGRKLEQHTVGGSGGVSYNLNDDMRIGFAFAADFGMYTHGKEYFGEGVQWHGASLNDTATALGVAYLNRFGFTTGLRYTWTDMIRFNIGYGQKLQMKPVDSASEATFTERHALAMRFDLLMFSKFFEVYGGMSVDLRKNESVEQYFGHSLQGYERFGFDMGMKFVGISNMELLLGYFVGNKYNGGIDDTNHWDNRFPHANGESGSFGNHMYIRTKFWW
ncbi:hypothetical protein [Entomospira culicis]|uniref:Alginate export domain-containing protein n=1 Tax=Entomospira culicis TaxID=2719989 RepID=A0A968GE02_9SPIO|nr:hypothetical protein [Entomospira culicis]NIZ18578.1 hypothetical protein [Entomospira culicis]NIZ68793.1 hypothetical protein [Entomospira culicis]WDI37389.1 hypothetical protein PVA46_00965 [Entomospira culicis]WDI39018.1 hypothetical protein PVA47_00975 [Entomospira culicis]